MPRIFTINKQLIFDNVDFINKNLRYHAQYRDPFVPNYIDQYVLEIAGWKINTQATIYDQASSKKVIENIGITKSDLKVSLQKFFQPFLLVDIIRYRLRGDVDLNVMNEPCLALYLRFCFWYGECAKKYDMELKRKEIRNKIMPKNQLINYLNNYKLSNSIVKGWYIDTFNITYELMLSFLCDINNKKISFVKSHDFVLENYPAEVKTISKDVDQDSGVKYPFLNESIKNSDTPILFENLIKDLLKLPNIKNDHLWNAIIKQGGRIIFINFVLENASQFFTQLSEHAGLVLNFQYSLERAFNMKNETIIPIIVTFHAIHEKYTIFSITIKSMISENAVIIL